MSFIGIIPVLVGALAGLVIVGFAAAVGAGLRFPPGTKAIIGGDPDDPNSGFWDD